MKKQLLILIGILISGILLGRYTVPREVEIVEVEKEVIKEVVKYIETKKRENNINIKIIETLYPDGRKVTETYKVDKSVVFISKKEKRETESTKESLKKEVIKTQKPQWLLGASAGYSIKSIGQSPIYGINADRRILGPVFLGLGYNTDNQIKANLRIEF